MSDNLAKDLLQIIENSKTTYNHGGSGEFKQLDETKLMENLTMFVSEQQHMAWSDGYKKGKSTLDG